MDLSRICIDPRLRSSWEAVDLGFLLARRWYLPLLLCWALPCLPIVLLATLCFSENLWIALIVLWWLKPLFDRLPLLYMSQALFGASLFDKKALREAAGLRTVLKQVLNAWRFQWLPWLTIRRFNFTRSFDLPVTVLEQLAAKPRAKRLSVLHRQNTGAAIWLTIVCAHLELLFVVGCFTFVSLLIPEQLYFQLMDTVGEDSQIVHWLDVVLSYVAMAVIAPFYIASGFALYISRRIELEAWDVEIRFRHLAEKQSKQSLVKISAVILCCSVMMFYKPPAAMAEIQDNISTVSAKTEQAVNNSEQAKKLVEEILARDDFHVMKEVTRWRVKPVRVDLGEGGLPNWFMQSIAWLEAWLFSLPEPEENEEANFSTLALILEIILWCAAVLAISLGIYIYRSNIHRLLSRLTEKPVAIEEQPDILFGLEVSKDSLPDDIPSQVKELCARGDIRHALSLLYRASISGLMHQHGFTFYDSYTEGECIRVVQCGGDQPLSQFTKELTEVWQQLAYGHQVPSNVVGDQLCLRWQELFSYEE